MKLKDIIFQNLKEKKLRTSMCVIGIILSTMTVMVISMTSERYNQTASGFFVPFDDYRQIIEKGTNFFQFLPIGSFYDESYESEIDQYFNVDSIPSLLVGNDESISSLGFDYIMGLNLSDMSVLWRKYGLSEGSWPSNTNEVIVGSSVLVKDDLISFNNASFHVSGVLTSTSSFMDGLILVDLVTLQQIYDYMGKISILFIDKQIESNLNLEDFDLSFPLLDFITTEDQERIKGGMGDLIEDITGLFNIFSILASLVFVFTVETITINSRKKDISALVIIGAPKKTLMKMLWLEVALLTFTGLIIGIPLSFFTYIMIFSGIQTKIGARDNFWSAVQIFTRNTFQVAPFNLMFQCIGIIFFGGLLMALIPASIVFRINALEEIKEKI